MKSVAVLFSVLTAVILMSAAPGQAQVLPLVAKTFGMPGADEQALGVRQFSDGSIFLGGSSSLGAFGNADFSVSRLSSDGDSVLWTRFAGTSASDFCHYMNKAGNEALVLVGSSYSAANGSIPDGLIFKVDTAGAIIFQQSYGLPNRADSFNFVEQTSDNGFIVCGFTSNTMPNGVGNDALVVKYNAQGNFEWQTILGGFENDYAQEIHQTSDGGFIVGVDSKSYNVFGFYDCIAYKLNAAGTEMWHTIAGGDTLDTGNQGIIITQAGDYVLFGEAGSPVSPGFDLTIAKVHRNGNLLWQRNIPAIGTEAAFSATEMPNTNLLLTGYSNANTAGASATDAFILETDSAGTPITYTYSGGPANEIMYDIQPSVYGGYLIGGATQNGSSFDYYLLMHEYPGPVAAPSLISEKSAAMHIFPNPAALHQSVSIRLPEGNFDLSLFDLAGRICWTGTTSTKTSTLKLPQHLQAGIYVLQAANAAATARQKVVITGN